jgi:hypothetical protein
MLYSPPGIEPTPWVVMLCAYRFSGPPTAITNPAASVIGLPGPGQGPTTTSPPDRSVDVSGQLAVRVVWGVGGATEQADVDWPPQGNSFTVFASSITVEAFARAGQGLGTFQSRQPLLSAFMTPGRRSSLVRLPTYTSRNFNVPAGQVQYVAVPDRAVAFRVASADEQVALSMVVFQNNVVATSTEFENIGPNVNEGGTQTIDGQPIQRGSFYTLHPSTQFISVQNPSATLASNVFVQFLLDLG